MKKITSSFHRFLASVGVAVSSIVEPVQPPSTSMEPIRRKESFKKDDLVGFESPNLQKEVLGLRQLDEHTYRYTRLDDLVNFQDHKSGMFWKKINYHSYEENGVPYCILTGTRNDGIDFSAKAAIDHVDGTHIQLNNIFDNLCVELNQNLAKEN